jgi:hypothetical protein
MYFLDQQHQITWDLDKQVLGFHSRSIELELGGGESWSLCSVKPPSDFDVQNHCCKW